MDKYEEFKDWFMGLEKLPTKIDLTETPIPPYPMYCKLEVNRKKVFKQFEKELEEKQKEERDKQKIAEIVSHNIDVKFTHPRNIVIDAENLYKQLKEGDYLK